MRVHIIPLGFTPAVFTNSQGPLMKSGADKIIAIHTKESDPDSKEKVEKTYNEVKKKLAGVDIERIDYDKMTFADFVGSFVKLYERFGNSDSIFVHIGGGQRHIGIALIYASFFTSKNVIMIPVLEYGSNPADYEYEIVHPIKPVELTTAQKKILKLVMEKSGQTLREISLRENSEKPESVSPTILRHLRNLVVHKLVLFDGETKSYEAAELAGFFTH